MTLEGSLHDLSLIDLLQIVRMGAKTGELRLIGGSERGVVYVRAGCLIDAVIERCPERQVIATADDAVIGLLQWQAATFTFQPDPHVNRRTARIVHDHEWLIREGRRQSERALSATPDQVIALDTCFALSRHPAGIVGVLRLDLAQWRILNQVVISPSARTICARTGQSPEQALADLVRLLAIGLVEVL